VSSLWSHKLYDRVVHGQKQQFVEARCSASLPYFSSLLRSSNFISQRLWLRGKDTESTKFHRRPTETQPFPNRLSLALHRINEYGMRMTNKQKRTITQQPSTAPMRVHVDAPVSPHWAFIVQFRAQPDGGPVYTAGRIEHLVSGRTSHFASLDELVTYFARELNQDHLSSST
jgi:hypothetical protein